MCRPASVTGLLLWSEVVFSSPRLWSSISIDVAKIDEKHAALVKFYLRNSGQYPLKIDLREHIEHCTPADYEEIEDAHDALGETGFSVFCSLMQQSYRFAEFRCSYSDNLIALLDPEDMGIGKNKFPLLLSFYDYRDASTTATNPQWFWKSIKAAPIKRLSLYRLGSLDYLPCDHVQSLVIRIPDRWSLLLNFLGRLPRLESLTLHFVKLDQSSPFRPIILPQLRDLVITAEWPPANLDPFFAVLALPMLSSLKLTAGDDVFFDDAMGPWDLSVTFSPMLRSSPLLRDVALHIFTSPISATAATGMLRVLPNLTHLTLEYRVTQTEPSVISVLCSRMQLTHNVPKISESEILLPCLQYLAFHERWFECGDADKCISTTGHFLDMVEARKQESGSLQDVSLVFCRDGQCDKPLRLLFPESLASRVTTLKATGIRKCNIRLPTYG
ncbi:hypothetical protein MPER_07810 [Moniliophthora perniciosa FA553]|nr:hypothetical protein MPER_07810 [Moniliophthora perniciosa FA553]